MKVELIDEPKIEFAEDFLSDDPKMGITAKGFYSMSNNSHRSEIHYAIIGSKQNIQDLQDWLNAMKSRIEATTTSKIITEHAEIEEGEVIPMFDDEDFEDGNDDNSYVNKKLNPDFPGFNKESVFNCELLNNNANNIPVVGGADRENCRKQYEED